MEIWSCMVGSLLIMEPMEVLKATSLTTNSLAPHLIAQQGTGVDEHGRDTIGTCSAGCEPYASRRTGGFPHWVVGPECLNFGESQSLSLWC